MESIFMLEFICLMILKIPIEQILYEFYTIWLKFKFSIKEIISKRNFDIGNPIQYLLVCLYYT